MVLVVAASAIAAVSCGADHQMAGGPLAGALPVAQGASAVREPGVPITFGLLEIVAPASSGVRLRSVEPLHRTGGMEVIGMMLTRSDGAVGVVDGFPPTAMTDTSPVPGATVAAGDRAEVLIGLRNGTDGMATFSGIAVEYTWRGDLYVATYPLSMRICSPTADFPSEGSCRTPLASPA
jgi:hypothetical protein